MVGAALFARLLEKDGMQINVMIAELINAMADPDTPNYFNIYLNAARLSDKDYKIYIKSKPEISREEIEKRLPDWLKDKADAFL